MENQIYYKSISINTKFSTATIITTTSPMVSKVTAIAGIEVGVRVQHKATFGLLSIIDPKTNKSMAGNSELATHLQKTLSSGDVLEGFKLSSNPVIDRETGEATDMFWVEAV